MSIFDIWLMWLEELGELTVTLTILGINFGGLYFIYRLIKYFIRYHAQCQSEFAEQREQKRHNQQTINDINKELDEIEASLDAMSTESPDSKITPIWSSKPPKR